MGRVILARPILIFHTKFTRIVGGDGRIAPPRADIITARADVGIGPYDLVIPSGLLRRKQALPY